MGPWRTLNSYTGPILLPRYDFTHINIHAKYTSNLS